MFPYISNTPEDEKSMFHDIGIQSIDELFNDIPEEIKLKRRLQLEKPMAETQVMSRIGAAANKNVSIDKLTCFLGAGAYDHYVPSVIKHIISRSEFYTAYTPYQPEISQGTLQAIFEYQTMICSLTGMDVSNASMYDGATACAEAAFMAVESTRRSTIIVSKAVNPEIRRVLKTYTRFKGIELLEIDIQDGVTDVEKLNSIIDNKTAAVIVQNPNFFGIVEDFQELEKITHKNKSLFIMNEDPISLGILKTPGEIGADIAVGEGQSLGGQLSFGGPYLGFMAVTSKLMRKMPGRVVGETKDVDGKRAYVLTLQAREQHIRRQKATSNICSNEAINALCAAIYMSVMGKQGIKEVAQQCTLKAHYACSELIKSGKYRPLFNRPFFMEFAVTSDMKSDYVNSELLKNEILGGYELKKEYPSMKNGLLFCVTEKRTKPEIRRFIDVMEGIK